VILLDPEVRDFKVDVGIESGVLQGLFFALDMAPVHHHDPVGGPVADSTMPLT
jgi:hypothetical protein